MLGLAGAAEGGRVEDELALGELGIALVHLLGHLGVLGAEHIEPGQAGVHQLVLAAAERLAVVPVPSLRPRDNVVVVRVHAHDGGYLGCAAAGLSHRRKARLLDLAQGVPDLDDGQAWLVVQHRHRRPIRVEDAGA